MRRFRLGFVVGLSDKKLAQKLAPLQAMPEVLEIDLYRRKPYTGQKVRWMAMPRLCTRFAPLGDLWRFLTLVKKAGSYDVLIGCHQRFHGIYVALAGVLRRRAVIQMTITDPAWIEKTFLGAWSLQRASAIGFRGQTTLERFRDRHGNKKTLFLAQNVWDPPKPSGHRNKTIDLLYVGNLMAYKNIPAWLQTAADVKRRQGRLRSVLVGERLGRRLTVLAKRLGLWDDLKFTGPLFGKDLDRLYAESRVLLLTSFWEGLPMAAAEAMAVGIPVVATDGGDIRELVKDGENGYLVSIGDVRGAASAVVRLLNDNALYQSMSESARRSASDLASKSTLERVVQTWRQVFVEIGLITQKVPGDYSVGREQQ